jgi:hypothetical protein
MWVAWREIKKELGGEYPPQGDLTDEKAWHWDLLDERAITGWDGYAG